jgi:hypothetical protein
MHVQVHFQALGSQELLVALWAHDAAFGHVELVLEQILSNNFHQEFTDKLFSFAHILSRWPWQRGLSVYICSIIIPT